ncbi:hypothetical protein L5470_06730 [Synechococcus sp. PCC 6717]|uniref:Uncharacterized protein n=1 Tax=Parathermosynechococcus lividus PCC 6715 TaxID=1917166 RepID=A0A2D2Q2M5_PARLV|nr:hypothetical protein [Thermostichus lividus]ATS18517.1 hypothetical protein BRW62_06835 [Thermostichus lividus PCC 6715]MCI3280673.1 hypothetical protein [Synechococcus sp. PCC 6717]
MRRQPLQLDLFPFLSILACTIGTLILLVVVISVSSLTRERTTVQILARETAQNDGRAPRYLECRRDGVVIHPQRQLVLQSQLASNTSLLAIYLANLRNRGDREYVIIAVRPDGFPCFEQVREQVERAGLAIGYEPFNAEWELCVPAPGRSNCP